jgi:feruloyl-CoA synthase
VEAAPLDEDGFLPTGDAGQLVDETRPEAGVAFAGRISENFKLSTGTWVHVGAVRLALVDACATLVTDAVIAGQEDQLGALFIPAAQYDREKLAAALAAYNRAHPASSERIARALVLSRALSLDEGETTDKGYTNQRRVLETRAEDVVRLFAAPPSPDVLVLGDRYMP